MAQRLVAGALLALGAACAHAPPPAPLTEVAWPAPPAAPLVRLAGLLPDPAAAPRQGEQPWWRRALGFVAGDVPARERAPALVRPYGVAVAADGAVLVADPDAQRVTRWARGRGPADLVCDRLPWNAPMGVAVAEDGAVLVADAAAGRVVEVAGGACRSLGEGLLSRPSAVALGPDRLYVVDPPAGEVVVLSRAGALLDRWTGAGAPGGRLLSPSGLARDGDGALWVVDTLSFRVVRLSAEGLVLGAFGSPGEDGAGLARPKAVAVGPEGRLYVSDAQRDLVLVFDASGAFVAPLGAPGDAPGRLAHPAGLAVAGDRLFVADSFNARVQVFEILGGRP